MKKNYPSWALGLVCASLALSAQARDAQLMMSIDDAMNSPQAQEVLDPSIKVIFGKGGGQVIKAGLVSNKKTNAFNKSDEEACQWAFLSAVKQFQESAKKMGGSHVVNLISYYRKNAYRSSSQYECHAGNVVAGVALKGDIAR